MKTTEPQFTPPEQEAIKAFEREAYQEAFQRFTNLSQQGSLLADFYLGWMLKEGKGTARDLDGAKRFFERSAAAGTIESMHYLGAVAKLAGSTKQALSHYEKAAAAGYLPAMYAAGRILVDGDGVPVDVVAGKQLLEQAMAGGHVFAMRKLAGLMLAGKLGAQLVPKGLLMLFIAILRGMLLAMRDVRDDRLKA